MTVTEQLLDTGADEDANFDKFAELYKAAGYEESSGPEESQGEESAADSSQDEGVVDADVKAEAETTSEPEEEAEGGDSDGVPAASELTVYQQAQYDEAKTALAYAGLSDANIEALGVEEAVRLGTKFKANSAEYKRVQGELSSLQDGATESEDIDEANATDTFDLDEAFKPVIDELGEAESAPLKKVMQDLLNHVAESQVRAAEQATNAAAGQQAVNSEMARVEGIFPDLKGNDSLKQQVLTHARMLHASGNFEEKDLFERAARLAGLTEQVAAAKVSSKDITASQPKSGARAKVKTALSADDWDFKVFEARHNGASLSEAKKMFGARPESKVARRTL